MFSNETRRRRSYSRRGEISGKLTISVPLNLAGGGIIVAGGEMHLAGGEMYLAGGEMIWPAAKILWPAARLLCQNPCSREDFQHFLGKIFAGGENILAGGEIPNVELLFSFYLHSIPVIEICPKLLHNYDFT